MNDIISVERNGSVATVTIDRGEKRNALNQEMVLSLTRIAEEFQNDTSTTCVVLTGNAKEFSAGIDLGDPARWSLDDKNFIERRRSEEHTSELQSLMRISYAVFCLKKKNKSNRP